MESPLCKCLHCNIILIDNNPQVNAPIFEEPYGAKEMIYIDNEMCWVCPECNDDGNLIDIKDEQQIKILPTVYTSESGKAYTYADALEICRGNPILANQMLAIAEWQGLETIFLDWINEGEITEDGQIIPQTDN